MRDRGAARSYAALLEVHFAQQPGRIFSRGDPIASSLDEDVRWRVAGNGGSFPAKVKDAEEWTAANSIEKRLGVDRFHVGALDLLDSGTGSARLRIYLARRLAVDRLELADDRRALPLVIEVLRDGLADPDPVVRAGAILGLGEAGLRGRESLPAIEALRGDADRRVREAAEMTAARMRDAAERRSG